MATPVRKRVRGAHIHGSKIVSQKIQKSWISPLTLCGCGAYIRLTNEGGTPLAALRFGLVGEIIESRVSDTRPGPEPNKLRALTLRL